MKRKCYNINQHKKWLRQQIRDISKGLCIYTYTSNERHYIEEELANKGIRYTSYGEEIRTYIKEE